MKRTEIAACVLFLFLCFPSHSCFAQSRGLTLVNDAASGIENWGNYYALVIGIDKYKQWRPLKTAVRDATGLCNVLEGRYGFDKKNVVLLLDEDATRRRIIQEVRYFAGGLSRNDNLLIYYAGHGQLDDLTGDGYWIPVEGALKDASTWVSNSVLKSVLSSEKVEAKNVVIIADSCYSGSLLRAGPSMLSVDERNYTEKLARAAELRSRQVISSGGVEPVADGGRDGHSLFAYYFLKALRENDRDVIDLENLFHTRVWGPVTEVGDQRPNVGRLKSPMDEDGQFVLTNVARAQQIAALKAAETEQAARHQDQLAALMAEKQRLEAERKRLELEKQLMEEKKKLDAERLEMERQSFESQRRLAEERRKLEAEKMRLGLEQQTAGHNPPASEAAQTGAGGGSMQTAALSVPAPRPDSGLPLKIALMPWKLTSNSFVRDVISEHGTFDRVLETVAENQHFRVSYSYYDFKAPGGAADQSILPLGVGSKEADALWQKDGLLADPKPSVEASQRLGRKLGFDLALFISCKAGSADFWQQQLRMTLVDVSSGRVVAADKTIRFRDYNTTVPEMLNNQLKKILNQKERPPTALKHPASEAAQTDAGGGSIQTASLSVPAPRPASGLPLKIALMPWKINPSSWANTFISERGTYNWVLEAVAEDEHFSVSHSYYDFNPPAGTADHSISPLSLSPKEADALWQKDGFLSNLKPSVDAARRLGKNLGFDAGLFISCHSNGINENMVMTLVDIGSGRAIVTEKTVGYRKYDLEISNMLKGQLKEFLDKKERPPTALNHSASEAAQTDAGGGSIQTASLSVPAPRPDSGQPLKIALMPWKINPPGYANAIISERATFNAVLETVAENQRFRVSHSYYDYKPPPGTADDSILPLGLSSKEAGSLWQKDGFLSSLKPSVQATQRLGKNLGFDAALFVSCNSDGMNEMLLMTLVDVGSGQAVAADLKTGYHDYDNTIRKVLEHQLKEILQQRGS